MTPVLLIILLICPLGTPSDRCTRATALDVKIVGRTPMPTACALGGMMTAARVGAAAGAATETNAGIAEIATQAETDTGSDDARIVTPAKLANWSGRIRKVTQTIGDGSATQIDVAHNLSTRDVAVSVHYNSGNYDTVLCDVQRISTSTVRLKFESAPASNALRVVVVG